MIKSVLHFDAAIVQVPGVDKIDVLPAISIEISDADSRPKLFKINRYAVVALEMRELNTCGTRRIGEPNGLAGDRPWREHRRENKKSGANREERKIASKNQECIHLEKCTWPTVILLI